MYRNPLWMVFLSLCALGILIYSFFAAHRIWDYLCLNTQTSAQQITWTVLSENDDRFIPQAHYHFNANQKTYQGETRWQQAYLNAWTAQEAISRLIQHPPPVWYNKAHPEISSLEKRFPYKESFYALILWGLGLYFLALGYRVASKFKN